MGISTKVTAAAVGTAVATILWTVTATFAPGVFTDTAITTLTGATGTVFAFVFGYWIPDRSANPS
jgi:hypothetical protein